MGKDIKLRDLTQVTFGFGNHEHPVFSPDGKWIAYYAGTYGYIQLFLVDEQGRNRRPLTCARGNHTQAAWSPDGKWIYCRYQTSPTSPWEIWRILVEDPTVREQILAKPKSSFKHPSPSPDGKWLSWFSDDGSPENFHLWKAKIDAKGKLTGMKQLTDDPGRNDCHPVWSPDGKWIVFHAYMGKVDASTSHIFVCDADGGHLRQLSEGAMYHKHPFFVGSQLVIHHTEEPDGLRYLALRQLKDGKLVSKLTGGKKNDKHPSPFVPSRGATRIVFASKKRGEALDIEGVSTYDIFWGFLDGVTVKR